MVSINPFRAIVYNRQRIDMSKILAPPYDTLTTSTLRYYQQQSPYNAIHLEVPNYLAADQIDSMLVSINSKLEYWLHENILTFVPNPSLYIYKQSYKDPIQDKVRQRIGIIAALFIDPHHITSIKPHENVKEEHILSRMKYIETTRLQTNPILFIYEYDQDIQKWIQEESRKEPFFQIALSKYESHQIYLIEDDENIRFFQEKFIEKDLVIADGHHRFESLRRINSFHKDHPFPYALACLVGANENNAYTLGYHRLVRTGDHGNTRKIQEYVERYFRKIEALPAESLHETFVHKLAPERIGVVFRHDPVVYIYEIREEYQASKDYFAGLKTIDILDNQILAEFRRTHENDITIEYTPWMHEMLRRLELEKFDVGFLLDSISYHLILSAGISGIKLPPKSTYFYPKLPTGLIMYRQ